MPEFLACLPNVFVVRDAYQIVLNTAACGICRLFVGAEEVYETFDGVYPSESTVHKFTLPQKTLDDAASYTVTFRAVPEKKPYFTQAGEEQSATFAFRPCRGHDLRAVYLADVHGRYAQGLAAARAYTETPDFLIINGDLGEIDSPASLVRMNEFIGRLSGGGIPVLYGRGNHDTRGRMAEILTRYMPADNGRTYFPFRFGPLGGAILDWGEDKRDDCTEYGGVNCFEHFRRTEAREIAAWRLPKTDYRLVVSHVPLVTESSMHGPFDIMKNTYLAMNRTVNRWAPDLMICGHTHKFEYYPAGKDGCHAVHTYPIAVASRIDKELSCTGLHFTEQGIELTCVTESGEKTAWQTLPVRADRT